MAQKDLYNFLQKLDKELKTKAQEYRTSTTDRLVANLRVERAAVKSTFYTVLNEANVDSNILKTSSSRGGVQEHFDEAIKTFMDDVHTKVSALKTADPENVIYDKSATPPVIEVVFLEAPSSTGAGNRSNYNLAVSAYKDALDILYARFLELVIPFNDGEMLKRWSKSAKNKETGGQGAFIDLNVGTAFHLEHDDNQSNLEIYIADASVRALNDLLQGSLNDSSTNATKLMRELNNLDGNYSAIRIEKDNLAEEINVFLGDGLINVRKGGSDTGKRNKLIKQVNLAMKELRTIGGQGLEGLTGSDSLAEVRRKKQLKKIIAPFEKVEGAAITLEDTKVKGKKSSSSLKVTGKAKRSTKGTNQRIKRRSVPRAKPKEAQFNQAALLALFNARLPTAIINNMGDPALNNRTGRFAASVRVIDIFQTPKGFPSIGYTYRKSPYSTFEQGGKQGSIELDPRRLIDKTIREIAAEQAMGRLFTRRL